MPGNETAAFTLGALVALLVIGVFVALGAGGSGGCSCSGGDTNVEVNTGGGSGRGCSGGGCSGPSSGGCAGGHDRPDTYGTTASTHWNSGSTAPTDTAPTSDTADSPVDTGGTCDRIHRVSVSLGVGDPDGLVSPVAARDATAASALSRLRTWETFDYYDLPYAPGATLEARLGGAQLDNDEWRFQLAFVPPAAPRRPLHLAILVDPTLPADEVETADALADGLAAALQVGDVLSIRSTAGGAAATLDTWSLFPDVDGVVRGSFDAVFTEGGSQDLDEALAWAYGAVGSPSDDQIRRIWVVTGGDESFSGASIQQMRDQAAGIDGIRVGILETGTDWSPWTDTAARAGIGPSLLLDGPAEATRAMARFDSLVEIAAEDLVSVELELPPGFQVDHNLVDAEGAPNDDEHPIPAIRPLVRQLRTSTCAPDLATADAMVTLTAEVRGLEVPTDVSKVIVATTLGSLLADDLPAVTKGRALLDYARWAALPSDPALETGVLASLDAADLLLPGDPDLAEIRAVVTRWLPTTTGGSGGGTGGTGGATAQTGGSGAATGSTGTGSTGTGVGN